MYDLSSIEQGIFNDFTLMPLKMCLFHNIHCDKNIIKSNEEGRRQKHTESM